MAIWNGLLFGMMLQLSVGPVCLAVLHRAMTRRLRDALMMVLGVALADAVYMVGSIGGLSFAVTNPLGQTPSGRSSFWHGVLLTLANPLTVLFWAGVFGSLLASGTFVHSTELFLFATGCLVPGAGSFVGRVFGSIFSPGLAQRVSWAQWSLSNWVCDCPSAKSGLRPYTGFFEGVRIDGIEF